MPKKTEKPKSVTLKWGTYRPKDPGLRAGFRAKLIKKNKKENHVLFWCGGQ